MRAVLEERGSDSAREQTQNQEEQEGEKEHWLGKKKRKNIYHGKLCQYKSEVSSINS